MIKHIFNRFSLAYLHSVMHGKISYVLGVRVGLGPIVPLDLCWTAT